MFHPIVPGGYSAGIDSFNIDRTEREVASFLSQWRDQAEEKKEPDFRIKRVYISQDMPLPPFLMEFGNSFPPVNQAVLIVFKSSIN